MENSVYIINKGINRPIEFKGLKSQYIWYLGGGVVVLLIIFAMLYLIGINTYVTMFIVLALGAVLVVKIYAMSSKYGEFGLMKELARRSIPKMIKCNSRKVYRNFSKDETVKH